MPTPSLLAARLQTSAERSWALKLAWCFSSLLPLILVAVIKHGPDDGLFAALPLTSAVLVFGVFVLPFIASKARQGARRKQRAALTPLQRLQLSDEPDYEPLSETLKIDSKPPVQSLPPALQAAIRRFGTRPRGWRAALLVPLSLFSTAMLIALSILDAPLDLLAAGLNRPWPLSYWTTYAIVLAADAVFIPWHWLRQMHDHYTTEAQLNGRRPFPALRA